jgi:glycosyltransferase involved in cell wall biosynthesis
VSREARGRPLVVAWAAFQPRTVGLGRALGGDAVVFSAPWRHPGTAPLRYLAGTVRTWWLLERRRPSSVVAVTPPVIVPMAAWLWTRLRGRPLAIDCHTGAFHSARWRWARPLHRWLLRRSRAALVHTDEALRLVDAWGAPALLLPDDVPDAYGAEARAPAARPTVLVAGSLDENEPIGELLAAAALLPDVEIRVTGDPGRLANEQREAATTNVVFTGFLPYAAFLGEMLTAHVVVVVSTDPHIMNRAAFEAVGLGRALVLSDLAGLRERFGDVAVFASNQPGELAAAIRMALARRPELEERSREAAGDLRRGHAQAVDRLRAMLTTETRRVLRITRHPFPADPIVRRDVIELAALGFEVDVVCAGGPDEEASGIGPGARPRVHRIAIRHRRGGPLGYLVQYGAFLGAATAVAGWLALRRRYETVQVDNLPDLLVFAAAVPRARGARVVLTLYELTPEMVAARFDGRAGALLTRLARIGERAAVRWADHIIVVSRPCLEALRRRGLPEARMSVVLNTMPWGRRPRPEPERAGAQVLVTHTTLVERYGVHVAIHALSMLASRWPGLRLRVVGGGEQLPALVHLAGELGLAGRVVFTGLLPWSRTLEEVGRARLGLVPILADGYGELLLPTKLLEYAWLGVPAVSSRLPAIQAYFPPDALAYAAPGDAADLAAQVDRLLREPDAAERQAVRASLIARDLGWERVRGTYLAALGVGADRTDR